MQLAPLGSSVAVLIIFIFLIFFIVVLIEVLVQVVTQELAAFFGIHIFQGQVGIVKKLMSRNLNPFMMVGPTMRIRTLGRAKVVAGKEVLYKPLEAGTNQASHAARLELWTSQRSLELLEEHQP
jgi:hypothetical protein